MGSNRMIGRRTAEVGMAAITGLFGASAMLGATEYGIGWSRSGPQPGTFPFYIGLLILVASIGNAITALMAKGIDKVDLIPFVTREQFARAAGFALPMIGFVIVSLVLGLYVGTALYMFGTLVLQNRYRLAPALIISLGLPVFFYLLIEKAFRVNMLKGPLEAALGL